MLLPKTTYHLPSENIDNICRVSREIGSNFAGPRPLINSLIDNSPNSRDARPEELRPLVDAGADEKAAVGAALDGQLPRASVVVRHEVLGGRGEVIEAILQKV